MKSRHMLKIGSDEYVKEIERLRNVSPIDFVLIHKYLDEEINYHNTFKNTCGCSSTLNTLCGIITEEKRKENIWKIFTAKSCNFDTYCSVHFDWIYIHFKTLVEAEKYISASNHPLKQNLLNHIWSIMRTNWVL